MGKIGKSIGKAWGDITGASAGLEAAQASAAAAGQASMAQQAEAKRQFDLINSQGLQLQNDVMGEARRYSVQELNALDQSVGLATRNIANQERLMASIDPTLMEASQQALKLLRGESASSLAPLQSQQATQRQALVNQLRSQGIGENSSAGLNALARFDQQAALTSSQAQQQQLGTLLGTTLSSRVDLGNSAQGLAGLGAQYGNIGARNANLVGGVGTTRLGALSGAGQQLIGNAGAQFTTGVLQNQATSNFYNNQAGQISGLAGLAAGAAFGGGAGAGLGSMLGKGGGSSGGGGGSLGTFWDGPNPYK